MRFAVPLTGGMLSPHFGHCEQFALIDVDPAKKVITRKHVIDSPGHQPGFLPTWLAEQGVSVVLTGGMGPRAQALFQQNRIKVVIGVMESNPDRAVLDYLNGKLVVGDNVCDH
jgi:ATP-binding protein involved in chromosome partitioning